MLMMLPMPDLYPGTPPAIQGGMVGRCYRWDGQYWRVVCRWRSPQPGDLQTWVAACCGHVVIGYDVNDPPDKYAGDESYCGDCHELYTSEHPRPAGHRQVHGVIRNVLLEKLVPYWDMIPEGSAATLDPISGDRLTRMYVHATGEEFELIDIGPQAYVPSGEYTVRPFRGLRKP